MPLEHYPTPKDLEDFWEAGKELDAASVLLAKSCGLSEPEYWSMVFVADGVATQREICALLSLSRQTINSAFKLLVAKGLIQLEPLEQDQRSKRASLTPKGERCWRSASFRQRRRRRMPGSLSRRRSDRFWSGPPGNLEAPCGRLPPAGSKMEFAHRRTCDRNHKVREEVECARLWK